MPIYEYVCPDGHKIELHAPVDRRDYPFPCSHSSEVDENYACAKALRRRVVPSSPAVALFQGPGFSRSSNMGKAR